MPRRKQVKFPGWAWQSIHGNEFGLSWSRPDIKKLAAFVPKPNDDVAVTITVKLRKEKKQ